MQIAPPNRATCYKASWKEGSVSLEDAEHLTRRQKEFDSIRKLRLGSSYFVKTDPNETIVDESDEKNEESKKQDNIFATAHLNMWRASNELQELEKITSQIASTNSDIRQHRVTNNKRVYHSFNIDDAVRYKRQTFKKAEDMISRSLSTIEQAVALRKNVPKQLLRLKKSWDIEKLPTGISILCDYRSSSANSQPTLDALFTVPIRIEEQSLVLSRVFPSTSKTEPVIAPHIPLRTLQLQLHHIYDGEVATVNAWSLSRPHMAECNPDNSGMNDLERKHLDIIQNYCARKRHEFFCRKIFNVIRKDAASRSDRSLIRTAYSSRRNHSENSEQKTDNFDVNQWIGDITSSLECSHLEHNRISFTISDYLELTLSLIENSSNDDSSDSMEIDKSSELVDHCRQMMKAAMKTIYFKLSAAVLAEIELESAAKASETSQETKDNEKNGSVNNVNNNSNNNNENTPIELDKNPFDSLVLKFKAPVSDLGDYQRSFVIQDTMESRSDDCFLRDLVDSLRSRLQVMALECVLTSLASATGVRDIQRRKVCDVNLIDNNACLICESQCEDFQWNEYRIISPREQKLYDHFNGNISYASLCSDRLIHLKYQNKLSAYIHLSDGKLLVHWEISDFADTFQGQRTRQISSRYVNFEEFRQVLSTLM